MEGGDADGKADAAVWWWVVLAHELAHNLVEVHNSEHSYYTYVPPPFLFDWSEKRRLLTVGVIASRSSKNTSSQ
jgi:hypothetical protein